MNKENSPERGKGGFLRWISIILLALTWMFNTYIDWKYREWNSTMWQTYQESNQLTTEIIEVHTDLLGYHSRSLELILQDYSYKCSAP